MTDPSGVASVHDERAAEPVPLVVGIGASAGGIKALKEFFRTYTAWQGWINVEKLYDFAETENSIFFQAIMTSSTGRWVVGAGAWPERGGGGWSGMVGRAGDSVAGRSGSGDS